jgi:hypothetical protein
MVMNLGFISLPHETQSVNPGVDFKVYLDMQMHLLANDPAFFGTYGAMWYHSAYADEEILRWAARLHRHYCIEGKRERLTNDPYVLPHIENPDFDQGTLGWMVQPAEAGSVFTGRALGYGWLQGRFKQAGEGDRFLVTRRRAKRPNRFSQTIRKLTPGRAYSLKMFITDYTELTEGKSAKTVNRVRINIDDAKLIPKSSFVEIVTNGGGHYYGKFAPGNNIQMTYRRVVFRPTRPTALLTVSDWAGDKDPGGPVGQKLAINFIEIEPYLDE